MTRPRDKRPLRDAELMERIRLAIGELGPISAAALYDVIGGSARRFRAALRELVAAGFVATIAPATRRGPRRHPLFVLPAPPKSRTWRVPANRDSWCAPVEKPDTGLVINVEDISEQPVSVEVPADATLEYRERVAIAEYIGRVQGTIGRSLMDLGIDQELARWLVDRRQTERS